MTSAISGCFPRCPYALSRSLFEATFRSGPHKVWRAKVVWLGWDKSGLIRLVLKGYSWSDCSLGIVHILRPFLGREGVEVHEARS